VTAAPEQDSPLAAMISAVADGQLITGQDKAVLALKLIDQAQERGASWAVIARVLGIPSGKQAKKDVHALREQVKRAERLGSRP
jgi:hypothetical protein